ncbi:hypothetical protein KC19_2G151700 [Ceratodon purpureus]|uniref:Uncharacterized protein n=1 Tax=Ceratodon purpureus TaxID=3225 RepID=A0A8T0IX52_CERPU|nr:hypothetical protein KC19_2G151700 [Ceratodon purpureus]
MDVSKLLLCVILCHCVDFCTALLRICHAIQAWNFLLRMYYGDY